MSVIGNKVVAVVDGPLDYALFSHDAGLPVLDEEECIAQMGEWEFVLELLHDFLSEREQRVRELEAAVASNSPRHYHEAAHALKGAALNLRLPALSDICKRAEALGKQLEVEASRADEKLLAQRIPLIDALQAEFERLVQYLPRVEQLVLEQQQQEGDGGMAEGGEGDLGAEGADDLPEDADDFAAPDGQAVAHAAPVQSVQPMQPLQPPQPSQPPQPQPHQQQQSAAPTVAQTAGQDVAGAQSVADSRQPGG